MKCKLSDISIITMGQSPKSSSYNKIQNGLPFLQGSTTFGDTYPYFDIWTSDWNKEANIGDILFSVRAPVAQLNIANTKIAIGRGIASIKPTKVPTKYLFYLLIKNRNKFLRSSTGTIFESINKDALFSIQLNIHTDNERNHIVNTIGSVDDLIEFNNKIIDKLKIYSDLIYQDYLNRSYNNTSVKLGDYCEIKTGKLNVNSAVENGKYPFFTCGSEYLYINNYAYDCKAIIISGNGVITCKYYDGKFNAYQRTYVLTPKKYFYLFLKSCEFEVNNLNINSSGSVIKFITKSMIEKISIILNIYSTITDDRIAKIYNLISKYKQQNIKLQKIKQHLLNKYF